MARRREGDVFRRPALQVQRFGRAGHNAYPASHAVLVIDSHDATGSRQRVELAAFDAVVAARAGIGLNDQEEIRMSYRR